MRGKRVRTRSGSRWRRSRRTGPRPSRSSRTMARATWSRGRSSSVKRSPAPLRRQAALAAHRLRDEEARRARDGQGRGMELHELHVEERRSRPQRHGHAVAGGHRRVRGLGEDLAGAAGGEQGGAGAAPTSRRPSSVRKRQPTTRPSRENEVGGAGEGADLDRLGAAGSSRGAPAPSPNPVASPRAWSTRLRECAPSRVMWKRPSSRSKRAPQEASSRMRSGPSSTRTRAAGLGHDARRRPPGCRRGAGPTSSSGPSATATPPCA